MALNWLLSAKILSRQPQERWHCHRLCLPPPLSLLQAVFGEQRGNNKLGEEMHC